MPASPCEDIPTPRHHDTTTPTTHNTEFYANSTACIAPHSHVPQHNFVYLCCPTSCSVGKYVSRLVISHEEDVSGRVWLHSSTTSTMSKMLVACGDSVHMQTISALPGMTVNASPLSVSSCIVHTDMPSGNEAVSGAVQSPHDRA